MSQIFSHNFNALGSVNKISLVTISSSTAERAFEAAQVEVMRIEGKFSRYLPESAVSQINVRAKTERVEVDQETAQLLNYAATCFTQSQGLFDITSGVLRSLWNFKQPSIPSQEERVRVCKAIGWRHVVWKDPYIQFTRKESEIDLGGIGKEYAVDRVVDILQKMDIAAGFVNLGGDIRSWGVPPHRDQWLFGVRHPRIEGEVIAAIPLVDSALASSGDYERFFEIAGKRYCHILNPMTGMPVSELQSVSVIAPLCTLAGSCSTIAMLFGRERGARFLEKMGLGGVMVDSRGEVFWINMPQRRVAKGSQTD